MKLLRLQGIRSISVLLRALGETVYPFRAYTELSNAIASGVTELEAQRRHTPMQWEVT